MKAKSKAAHKGILGGGNWIIDQVKLIDRFPQPESLANIRSQYVGSGGAPYNVLVNLSKMGADIPLSGAGFVGKDALGQSIIDDCKKHKIDTKFLKTTKEPTSYTDVMTEEKGGRRTFFHMRGANAKWAGVGLDFSKARARIFHLGYLLLLDALDAKDAKYGTKGARMLAEAQAAGLKTSVDVVSEDSDRFSKIVGPALKHTDYCILNEIEAGKTAGFKIRQPDGKLDTVSLRHAAGSLLQQGASELIVIHFPEGAFARTRKGEDVWQSAVKLPKKFIQGTAGAGDAFCAGVLLGLHEQWDLKRCLEFGVCTAAASLADPTCTGGMLTIDKCLELGKKYKFQRSLNEDDF